MLKSATTKIPTKTHLKKFLLKVYDVQEPFKIDNNTSLGKNLMSGLVDKLEYINTGHQMNDSLLLDLSSRICKRAHRLKHLIYINTLLDEMFKEALLLWVDAQGEEGVSANQATKNFLKYFKIEESEYTYDAAYKIWQRDKLRKPSKLKKSFPKVS